MTGAPRAARAPAASDAPGSVAEVFAAALRLGLTSFGGPIAHIGYFRRQYVERRRWLDEQGFADLVALCQFLPGPASSQLGIAIGTRRTGIAGGLAAWIGFTLPSAVALVLFAMVATSMDLAAAGWVQGLKLVAVAIVAHAVLSMAGTLTPDWPRRLLALAAAAAALLLASPFAQIGIIVAGGLIGWLLLRTPDPGPGEAGPSPLHKWVGVVALTLFLGLLVALPLLRLVTDSQALALFDTTYRAGSLVFGGGHVVLPLLHEGVVTPGWVSDDAFLSGYGAAQAVPGPLFTFAAYLGAASSVPPNGWLGAIIALGGIFLPSFLLIWGSLPFWDVLRASKTFRRALIGTNAAVVGILLAALYTPVATTAITSPLDLAIAAAAFALLTLGRAPPIAVVVVTALATQLLSAG
ncbi:MAG: chromate efflux transporter [Chloroflexi bacterium]|nr:chromate efflux transporter [Chloroflexota bacterium]